MAIVSCSTCEIVVAHIKTEEKDYLQTIERVLGKNIIMSGCLRQKNEIFVYDEFIINIMARRDYIFLTFIVKFWLIAKNY
jgi:hypothetical protein